jgi:hypothetical protein
MAHIDNRNKDVVDKLKINPFIDGPTQALVKAVAGSIGLVPEFKYIFGENIDTYERADYSERQLPALRVYNHEYTKEHESHYIVGELLLDIIWPPAIRRDETQAFQDILSSALLQQFRRPQGFNELVELVPGLNELGKVFSVNKQLGMVWQDGFLPVTEIRANFRIDLKIWDAYLESTGRTKDDPFNVTLKELRLISAKIQPVRDDSSPDVPAAIDLSLQTGGD